MSRGDPEERPVLALELRAATARVPSRLAAGRVCVFRAYHPAI